MPQKSKSAYHSTLESAVYDLVRIGSTGFASGVSQIASRLIRSVPSDVADPEVFRANLHTALKSASNTKGLRLAGAQVPTDEGSSSHLIDVELLPDGARMVLNEPEQTVLTDVVLERQLVEKLLRAGVPLTRTILFTGPPGVGKTLAARWLAQELELPLVTMSLAATVSSHLGTSGKNVKAVLDYAQSGPCILLLDEFDAIAKNRNDDTDIGELKRVVNVVLMELDRWPSSTLLIAATNHEHLLDPAIRRRFDTRLKFEAPDTESRKKLLLNATRSTDLPIEFIEAASVATAGATGSDIERIFNAASRKSLMHDLPLRQTMGEEIAKFTIDSGTPQMSYRFLSEQLQWSNRRIAAYVGITHPTVATALKRTE